MISRARSALGGTGTKLHPQVEPRRFRFFDRHRPTLLDQAVRMEGRHGLKAVEHLWNVGTEVSKQECRDRRHDGAGFWIPREHYLVVQRRRFAHAEAESIGRDWDVAT